MTTPLKDIQPLVDYCLHQRPRSPFLQNAVAAMLVYTESPGVWTGYGGHLSYQGAKPPTNVPVLSGNLNLSVVASPINMPSIPVVITLSDPITVGTYDLSQIFPAGNGGFLTTPDITPDTSNLPDLTLSFAFEYSCFLALWETQIAHEFKLIESITAGLKIPKGLAAGR
jgi:hypothetical protein